MPTFKFAKLVRDTIVDQQLASGAKPTYRQLSPEEHKQALVAKIAEESAEIAAASPDTVAEEIADVQQAIDDLIALCGLTAQDVATAQAAKSAKNGAFKKGLYVDTVEVAEDDKWTAYYRAHPDQYPELPDGGVGAQVN
jgi:predicted house-cleaning noncanonical NTP pyrophosphatase (MazG superfamily)